MRAIDGMQTLWPLPSSPAARPRPGQATAAPRDGRAKKAGLTPSVDAPSAWTPRTPTWVQRASASKMRASAMYDSIYDDDAEATVLEAALTPPPGAADEDLGAEWTEAAMQQG